MCYWLHSLPPSDSSTSFSSKSLHDCSNTGIHCAIFVESCSRCKHSRRKWCFVKSGSVGCFPFGAVLLLAHLLVLDKLDWRVMFW